MKLQEKSAGPVKLRLLQLEDDAPDAELIQDKLRKDGFELDTTLVLNKKDFLRALERERPDIILSDYSIPGFSGLEALELALKALPLTPFILISGTIGEDIAVEALKQGATDYIMKDRVTKVGFSVRRALAEAANKRRSLQAEAELAQAKARAEQVLRVAPSAFFTVDLERNITSWNQRAEELTGYSSEEITGKKCSIISDPSCTGTCGLYSADMGKPIIGHECLVKKKNGDLITVSKNVDLLKDAAGNIIGGIESFEDITARKQAEKDLQESLVLLESVVENAPFMVFVKDAADLRFVMFNHAGEELLGYDRKDLIGKSDLDFFPPEQAAWFIANDRMVMEKGGILDIPEEPILTAGKEQKILHTKKIGLKGPDGTTKYLLGISEDITARKKTEEQLRQAQKMESVGRLAGGVAHDFNNLVTAINGYALMLLKNMPHDDARRGDIQEILTAGDRAAALTRQLLAFSRKQILKPVTMDLNEAIEGASKMLGRLIGEDIKFEVRLASSPCLAKLDPGQIDQVLMNLAINARDAMNKGGELSITTEIVEMTQTWSARHGVKPGKVIKLSITDNGTGMTPEVKKHLFEPFFTTKDASKGTGLGLATVYGIVKQSGGEIEVDSAPERGTAFHIYFPMILGTEAALAEPATARPVGGHETILFVEDEGSLLKLGRRILSDSGYTVLTAGSGPGALKIMSEQARPIDLLITDLVMPGMDGVELARQAAARYPALRVLYMSGYTDDIVTKHDIMGPSKAFIQKPFSPDSLVIKVRLILDSPAGQAKP